jgi:hypothetical protein
MPSSAIHKRKASLPGSIPMYTAYSSTVVGSVSGCMGGVHACVEGGGGVSCECQDGAFHAAGVTGRVGGSEGGGGGGSGRDRGH